MIELKTERLLIRPLTIEDAEAFFGYRSDADANKFQGWIPKSINDARDFIQFKTVTTPNQPDTWVQLAVILRKENRLIGDIGIYFLPDRRDEVKLGYTLSSAYWNKGYATEALQILIDHLMISLDKTRFIALISPQNDTSIRLVKRLGFVLQKHEDEPDVRNEDYPDDLLYVLDMLQD